MTHYGYHDHKDQIQTRLKRAEGQVRGVAKMVESDAYCIDILTQIGAVQAALDKVAVALLRDHTRRCLTNDNVPGSADHKTHELVDAIERLLKVRS